jgi:ethanolamine utilization protein EutA (predicted chaperonin)
MSDKIGRGGWDDVTVQRRSEIEMKIARKRVGGKRLGRKRVGRVFNIEIGKGEKYKSPRRGH